MSRRYCSVELSAAIRSHLDLKQCNLPLADCDLYEGNEQQENRKHFILIKLAFSSNSNLCLSLCASAYLPRRGLLLIADGGILKLQVTAYIGAS